MQNNPSLVAVIIIAGLLLFVVLLTIRMAARALARWRWSQQDRQARKQLEREYGETLRQQREAARTSAQASQAQHQAQAQRQPPPPAQTQPHPAAQPRPAAQIQAHPPAPPQAISSGPPSASGKLSTAVWHWLDTGANGQLECPLCGAFSVPVSVADYKQHYQAQVLPCASCRQRIFYPSLFQ
jgi:hypothetical protein